MTVDAKLIFVETKKTAENKPFIVVYYQEVDNNGNATGVPQSATVFDTDMQELCKTLVPDAFYHFDLKVSKATLVGISQD